MRRLAQVSTLVGDIYGAALDPRQWPQVLQRALGLIGGTAAILFTRGLDGDSYGFRCAVGIEAPLWSATLARQSEPTCLERCEQAEPVGTLFQARDAAADVTCDSPAWPAELLGTLLEKSPTSITALYIRRRACSGMADQRSRAMLGLLAPHVRQAVCIGRRIEGEACALALRVQQAADRYGLTPAEVRVVQALLSGCTIERGAQLLGIRPATVKTHLQHVFDKTRARRQVDLIKLIAVPQNTQSSADRNRRW